MSFAKAAILGVGLLGASFSLALKKAGLCSHITGYGRSMENLDRALSMGIIDACAADPASACRDADLVLLASPVGAFKDLVRMSAGSLKRGALVTDVGSVKGGLVYELEEIMPEGVDFVGSHPIAGSDRSGIDHASAGLFDGAVCIITPTSKSSQRAIEAVRDIWSTIGTKIHMMGPEEHDRIYSAVSHLPHLIAYAMVSTVSDIDSSYFPFCGQGFRDMTRIAASSPDVWTDISMLNRENLLEMISIFKKNLDRMETALKTSDPETLKQELIRSSSARRQLG